MDDIFLAQFKPVDDGFLYRRNQNGPALKCSESEKVQFFSDFRKASRRLIRGTVLAIFIIIALAFMFARDWFEGSDWPALLIAGGILLFYFPATQMIYGAPEKVLEKSIPVSPGLTKQEWQKKPFEKIGWGLLVAVTGSAATSFGYMITQSEFSAAVDYIWLLGSGAVILVGLRSLWLKHRLLGLNAVRTVSRRLPC
ncbi:MAG: hypothetical protein KJP27_06200 [Altererythrobacter sp.]|nr:hypothetical protein [Altererythrobacter sp.]